MLRIGVVGCGKIADGHVAQARATGRAEVVAVCDGEPLMAEQLAVRASVPATYTELGAMLGKERLDVLHVATPPASHVAIAREAFAAGCHVFMEKPFALDAAGARQILDCAAATGRKVGVNYLYNFETPALQLRRWIAEGRLGDVVHLDCHYGYNLAGDYGLAVLSDPGHWVHGLPGKLFHNVLDHVLAKFVPLIGGGARVQTQCFRRREATGDPRIDALPDELRFLLRDGDRTASGIISAHGRPVAHALRVIGTSDSAELDIGARTLVLAQRQNLPSALGRLGPAFVQGRRFLREFRRNLGQFRRHEFHYFQGMRTLLSSFYASVATDAEAPVPQGDILAVCELIDSLVASMASEGVP